MPAETVVPGPGGMPQSGPSAWRRRLARDRDRSYWRAGTEDLIAAMRSVPATDQRADLKNYANWMAVTAKRRPDVSGRLVAAFAGEFARVATTLGEAGDVGVIVALDQAIELVRSVGRPTTKLHLAKAACYGSLVNEHAERDAALTEAVRSTRPGTARWADAMLARHQYYTNASQYKKAGEILTEVRKGLPADLVAARYECGLSMHEGYLKIVSMRDLAGAERDLAKALTFEAEAVEDVEFAMWVSMAHYHRGRIAELRGDHSGAVSGYLRAKAVRERWPRDPRTFAFYHLRIAESLIALGRLEFAKEHLDRSADLFRSCSDRGPGWLQCWLARASLEVAEGRYDVAVDTVDQARQQAREMGFHRGELLCLGYLVMLHVRHGRLLPAAATGLRVLHTGLHGELRRNGVSRLLRRLPTLIRILFSRTAGPRAAARAAQVPPKP
jgi:tetratricopeptide (TPR) repeat protein